MWKAASPTTVSAEGAPLSFGGQFGLIDFNTSIRLPRHVHIAPPFAVPEDETEQQGRVFVTERILVLHGVALVELNGKIYVIPPRTLVTIAPGVPHTWTVCTPDASFSEAMRRRAETAATIEALLAARHNKSFPTSDGTILMVYEYETETGFFPTEQIEQWHRSRNMSGATIWREFDFRS